MSIEINAFLDFKRHWRARYAGVKPSCLVSKWQPEQWRSGLESEVQCFRQQMHQMRPFPVLDHGTVLQNRFFAWCEVGACRARCCALSLALAPGPATRDLAGWIAPQRASSSSEAKPQNQTPNPSDAIHNRGVKSCKMWQRVSVRLSGYSKQLLWTMPRDRSRGVQGTNEHATTRACKQAAHQSSFQRRSK
jgi:hypothetical protein